MSEVDEYIKKRQQYDPEFAKNFETGYQKFRIGVLLKLAREDAGMTQEEVARKLNTKKSAISRIENHSEDIRLSTLEKYARAYGKTLKLELQDT